MADMNTASTDRRSEVHTEVRRPMEAIVAGIVWFVFGVIEVLLALRFVLLLLGANAEAGFVKLIYGLSAVFMAPFSAIFETQAVAGATFEWSVLVAIAIYALIAWGIVALIQAISPREQAATVERSEKNDTAQVS